MTKAVLEAREQLRREEMIANQPNARRSKKLREKIANLVEQIRTPSNYNEAKDSQNWPDWEKAMREELKSFYKHLIWDIVDKPDKGKITKSKWVLTKNLKF